MATLNQSHGRTPVIEARGLTKRYGDLVAANAVDFTVYRGDIFGFLGPNGSGKSTTIGMLLGLISPSAGEVRLFGLPQEQLQDGLARVGGIIEAPAFFPYLSGRDNLLALANLRPGVGPERVDEVLATVRLTDAANRKFGNYSMGMKQRLGIGWTLLHDPELLILDEPTNGLDPAGMIEVRHLLLSLADQGKTILVSSHLLHEIEQICDRLAVIQNGSVIAEGKMDELRSTSQRIAIRTSEAPRAIELLGTLPGIESVRRTHDQLLVEAPGTQTATINAALVTAGIPVDEIRIEGASLEEAFLHLTTHTNEYEVAA